MLQLHLSDQQFYCILRCDLYYMFYGGIFLYNQTFHPWCSWDDTFVFRFIPNNYLLTIYFQFGSILILYVFCKWTASSVLKRLLMIVLVIWLLNPIWVNETLVSVSFWMFHVQSVIHIVNRHELPTAALRNLVMSCMLFSCCRNMQCQHECTFSFCAMMTSCIENFSTLLAHQWTPITQGQ